MFNVNEMLNDRLMARRSGVRDSKSKSGKKNANERHR